MTTDHPREEQLQTYAYDKTNASPQVVEHIASCRQCTEMIEQYRALFTAIHQQQEPAFDFDIAAIVDNALQQKQMQKRNYFPYVLGAFILAAIASAMIILQTNLENLFGTLSHFFVFAAIGAAVILLGWQIGFLFKKYREQFRILNRTGNLQHYSNTRV